jgi:hypothetical protein
MVHNIELEQFDSCKQLGSVVNKDTTIEQQETGRIESGIKYFMQIKGRCLVNC